MTALDSTSRRGAGTRRGLRAAALLMVAAAALAACDDSDDSAEGVDSLGDDFVRAFSEDPNGEPVDASELSLTLTPAIEPFDPA